MNKQTIRKFDLQPITLINDFIKLVPLAKDDFEKLYQVASDPLIWEQHPTKNRYQREIFEIFFTGAMESKGAFIVIDAKTNEPIGSSRFYDLNEADGTIMIGYTFLARHCWGLEYNKALKSLMLNHAFNFVDSVLFHIGASNIRSQKAIEKLGAIKLGEEDITYSGEMQANKNCIYKIDKASWVKL
jgi:RimJ/RimL family protein N-acetyltransferase